MPPNEALVEKPLSAGARLALVSAAAAVILFFYLFSILAILVLMLLIALEFGLLLVLLRFGLIRLMARPVQKHTSLVTLLLKSFWLRKGVDSRITLQPADAPGLHAILDQLCARLHLTPPQEVALEMTDNAWVRLKGIRAGAGKTTLGMGYDLLAGLSVAEIEAVLAHEMAHAKLIQRGLRNWLDRGQVRMRALAMALWAGLNIDRRAKRESVANQAMFKFVDRLVKFSARLVAAYSRQDEFEADHQAARLCGSSVMKSALLKLDSLHRVTSRLPWNERVAHLQETTGYSEWLLHEIAQGGVAATENSEQVLTNKYSTHPLIRDRLLALPQVEKELPSNSPSAIQLLANPDDIALRLVTKLQQLIAQQEAKDSRLLEKYSRKTGKNVRLRSWQAVGVALMVASVLFFLFCFAANMHSFWPFSILIFGVGMLVYRFNAYRDTVELPVPSYLSLTQPLPPKSGDAQPKENEIELELAKRFAGERVARRAALLAEESYAALKTCNYLRAHAAGRLCLKANGHSIEGALALAVACASFHKFQDAARLLAYVQSRTGFKTFSSAWGAAWVALLSSDWARAEAMLEKSLKLKPKDFTLLALLAIAQTRRGKLQSAIANARQVCDARFQSVEHAKYLIARLLDGGYTREAELKLERLRKNLETDPDLMCYMAQLCLLQKKFADAEQWTARVKAAGASAQMLVRLGALNESARRKDHAAALYVEALAIDHYPEAHLGLGRIEADRSNKDTARQHILAALNIERPLGKEGIHSMQILQPILKQILLLHEPAPDCKAWITKVPQTTQNATLSNQSFLIYAPTLPQAQGYFQTLLNALNPGKPALPPLPNHWKEAPRPMQPDGPVRPGVQGIWV